MDKENSSQQQIAVYVAESALPAEREALKIWLKELLDIRNADISTRMKAKQALSATANNKVLWPMIKVISKGMKRYGWDKRKDSTRFGIVGAGVGLVLFGGQAAGVAALGGAVGVPLWIVLGAGAKFASMLYGELVGASISQSKTIYTVIDADKEES